MVDQTSLIKAIQIDKDTTLDCQNTYKAIPYSPTELLQTKELRELLAKITSTVLAHPDRPFADNVVFIFSFGFRIGVIYEKLGKR